MGTRAGRTLASLGLRYLRRQLHYDHGKQLPPVFSGNLAVLSSVEGRVDGRLQELWNGETKLLEPGTWSFEFAQKSSMKESFGSGSWHLQNAYPLQDMLKDEWSIGIVNGCRFPQEIHCWTSEMIAKRHGGEAVMFRDQDCLSRYLQWTRYDRLVDSQDCPEAASAFVSTVDLDGLASLGKQDCKRSSLTLQFSSSSFNFLEEPSIISPLEASSVKRKRKKKMNKHKQRKLRRRDRHRN